MTGNSPPLLIVNADDLGVHPEINLGIRDGFERGVVSSATLLATMPHVDHALEQVVRPTGLPVGLHLALTSGRPLAAPDSIPDLVDEKGLLRRSAGNLFRMGPRPSRSLLEQIRREWEAQLNFATAQGVTLTHVDSHQHVHMIPPLFALAVELAARFGIKRCRFVRESLNARLLAPVLVPALRRSNLAKWLILRTYSTRIHNPLRSPSHFFGILHSGAITAAALAGLTTQMRSGQSMEVCIHPGRSIAADADLGAAWRERGFITAPGRTTELEAVTAPAVRAAITAKGVRLGSFADL